ncbi:hypothetical protein ACOYR1_18700 [Thalassotalea piscium]
MKKFLIVLTVLHCLFMSIISQASSLCEGMSINIGAMYTIKKSVLTSSEDVKETKQTSFQLWRKNNDTLHVNSTEKVSKQWHKLINGEVRKTDYFDHYQRGIEFEPKKITDIGWEQKNQLVSNEQLSKMKLIETTGKGCNRIEHYQLKNEQISMELWWLPELTLAQKIVYIEQQYSTTWLLNEKIDSIAQIENVFKKYENYEMTDFADIGDNESDPFLRKMIHLGFIEHGGSGFYDAEGHQLSTNIHH